MNFFEGQGCHLDEACDPDPDPGTSVCSEGNVLVGEFATWCGKVNVHTDPATGQWMTDDNCTSGCNVNGIGYCLEYYPETVEIVETDVSPEDKPFMNAGCMVEYLKPGSKQYACCGPE
jgi:hypothetical protein